MTALPKPNDPSMEDILASIRRIIADDQAKVAPKSEEIAPEASFNVEDDILELTSALRAEAQPEPAPAEEFDQNDVDLLFREIEEEQQAQADDDLIEEVMAAVAAEEAQPAPAYVQPYTPAPSYAPTPEPAYSPSNIDMAGLLSPQAGASVSGAFSQLAHTVLSQNARTLDDLVKEMLKPMLKGWLDENLPTVVERLVRAEIERVARGGR